MLLVSTGFKAGILGPQSFAQLFAGGELRIFAGARPVGANSAEPSLPIGVVTRVGVTPAGLQFLQSGPYIVRPPSDKWTINVMQPGVPTWYRLVAANDAGDNSLTAARVDGDVGISGTANDMTLGVASFEANTEIPFESFLFTIPPLG